MKLIGLIGGMSWESTAIYYRLMNEEVKRRLGGLHSARILLHSVNFHEIEQRQHSGDWQGTAEILSKAASGLKAAGADFLVIATNTMHKVADEVETGSGLPVLHIADATGKALVEDGRRRVGLLGTRFTMEEDFYADRLRSAFGLDVVVPNSKERDAIHRIIYEELCLGEVRADARRFFHAAIDDLRGDGCDCIILGCTELTMAVDETNSALPLYDTTALHAVAAVEQALKVRQHFS
ncbi:aspartate/glutamate racemase family protein [Hoeflea prorocentri]|uniref:Aspartate/glutamate racemase family protein n=1 Tax=Hoeflea prorocentri TaxID=1922333 RepID=A0A9X3UN53_9HYPH|nr:aspartate/glutamate racemase family protein [Hoeflea prorocentri]MCY6383450.1 aspartate/glutamate racemase family protein [Hoeflea prorocentri]MDA5401250.1 aspartate/glutamate racemase family protein [Hoeflea prorocentri]